MAHQQIPDDSYSAKEAMARMGVSMSRFYALIHSGKIKKYTLPGKSHGFYKKVEIDFFAEQSQDTRGRVWREISPDHTRDPD